MNVHLTPVTPAGGRRAATVDAATVTAAVAGDHDAFAVIYTTYRPAVRKTLTNRMRGHCGAAVNDLVAETFLKAWRHIGRFQLGDTDIGAWLNTIAANTANDFHSSRARRLVPSGDMTTMEPPAATSTEELVIDTDTSQRTSAEVRRSVAKLTLLQRHCLHLRYVREASIAETARHLNLSINATKAVQFRAQKTLRILLSHHSEPARGRRPHAASAK